AFDQVIPLALLAVLVGGLALAGLVVLRRVALFPSGDRATTDRRLPVRRAPTWGCGGELTPRTEYTATAFSKPLMMIFKAVYRPTREVETLAGASAYFPQEVRYRSEIEPTFERYLYGPLVRGVIRAADGMKVLQAGSLHAYLAYVIVLVVSLMLLVWWRG